MTILLHVVEMSIVSQEVSSCREVPGSRVAKVDSDRSTKRPYVPAKLAKSHKQPYLAEEDVLACACIVLGVQRSLGPAQTNGHQNSQERLRQHHQLIEQNRSYFRQTMQLMQPFTGTTQPCLSSFACLLP